MMKTRLEEQMKGMMDNASLSELLPGFDSEALWAGVAPTLPGSAEEKRSFALNYKWAARIAAILLVAVGGYLAARFSPQQPEEARVVTVITTQPSPAKVQPAPVAAPIEKAVVTAPAANAPKTAIVQKHEAATAPAVLQPEPELQPAPGYTEPVQPALAAAAAPRKVKHYLDVDEDAAAVTRPEVHMAGPSLIQMKLNKPGYEGDMPDRRPLKDLAFALGK